MILSGKEILKHMGKEIIITPFVTKQAVSGKDQRVYEDGSVRPHAGGPFFHGQAGTLYPCDCGLWRYRLRRVLDAGDFLCAAGQNISECGDLPDLLPRY